MKITCSGVFEEMERDQYGSRSGLCQFRSGINKENSNPSNAVSSLESKNQSITTKPIHPKERMMHELSEWCEGHDDLITRVSAFALGAGVSNIAQVDLRRSSAGLADAQIILSEVSMDQEQGREFMQSLFANSEAVESTRVGRRKLTIRFSNRLIERQAMQLSSKVATIFGINNRLAGRTFLVDFCDPNATKALHVGHLRNLILGNTIANLLRGLGAQVVTQSIICDIGRNVCEAIAGYMKYAFTDSPKLTGQKTDAFVGKYYTKFIKELGTTTFDGAEPDAPIAREMTISNDLAQAVLDRWREGETGIRDVWRQIVNWVLEGHHETLACLGIKFDQMVFESESIALVEDWIERGISKGIFVKLQHGAVGYPTGRKEYSQLLLIRTDGFPTEHMRAIPIWARLQNHAPKVEACIHVMGNEWLFTTQLREELLRRFEPCPLYDNYHKIVHGMVLFQGSKMKSSTGEALLIDELMAELMANSYIVSLSNQSSGIVDIKTVTRITLAGAFLSTRTEDDFEFSMEWLLDPERNPGILLASAWSQAQRVKARKSLENEPAVSDDLRFVLLQAHRLRGFVERSIETFDTCNLVRYICRVARWYVEKDHDTHTHAAFRDLLASVLAIFGLISMDRTAHPHTS